MIEKNLKRFLLVLIVFFSGFMLIINIEHIVSINQKYTYNFNDGFYIKQIKVDLKTISNNLKELSKNNTHFSDEVYFGIYNNIKDNYEIVNNSEIFNYAGVKKFTQKQLFEKIVNLSDGSYSQIVNSYRLLSENNEKNNLGLTIYKPEEVTSYIYQIMLESSSQIDPLYDNYKYHIGRNTNDSNTTIEAIMSNISKRVSLLKELSIRLQEQSVVLRNNTNEEVR